jgi:hypothetical protein
METLMPGSYLEKVAARLQAHIDYEQYYPNTEQDRCKVNNVWPHANEARSSSFQCGQDIPQSFIVQLKAAQLPDQKRHHLVPLTETDGTQCQKAGALFTSDL